MDHPGGGGRDGPCEPPEPPGGCEGLWGGSFPCFRRSFIFLLPSKGCIHAMYKFKILLEREKGDATFLSCFFFRIDILLQTESKKKKPMKVL